MLDSNKRRAQQTRRIARQMESSGTYGTHNATGGAPREPYRPSKGPRNADRVNFSDSRKTNQARQGYVRQVQPRTRTGESRDEYRKRISRRTYAEELRRKASMKSGALIAVIGVAVVVVAVAVGIGVFFASSNAKLSLGNSNAAEALTAATEGEPFYVLCAAQLPGDAATPTPAEGEGSGEGGNGDSNASNGEGGADNSGGGNGEGSGEGSNGGDANGAAGDANQSDEGASGDAGQAGGEGAPDGSSADQGQQAPDQNGEGAEGQEGAAPENDQGLKTDSAYLLARVDPANKYLAFVSIPSAITLTLSDGQSHYLYEATSVGGDAELIRSVESIADVKISQFASIGADGLKSVAAKLGLDESTVPHALAADRLNYKTMKEAADTQIAFMTAVLDKALGDQNANLAGYLSDLSADVQVSWDASQLLALGEAFTPFGEATVNSAIVPGRMATDSGREAYIITDNAWQMMLDNIKNGREPDAINGSDQLDLAQITVTVRNGCRVDGQAGRMRDVLLETGFDVTGVGNVDDGALYEETFVIYHDEKFAIAAQVALADIGVGRSFDGGDFYTFDTDLLVIVGTDWVAPDGTGAAK